MAPVDHASHCVAKGSDGTVTGVGAIVEDVTERKRLERTQAILSAELQHRVKNILARVQAAATLTLKSSNSLEEFAKSFSGRLNAIVQRMTLSSATSGSQPSFAKIEQELIRKDAYIADPDDARDQRTRASQLAEYEPRPQQQLIAALVGQCFGQSRLRDRADFMRDDGTAGPPAEPCFAMAALLLDINHATRSANFAQNSTYH